MPSTATPFRSSLPLTATSFANKIGSIGLSLLPMLLVERQISTAESSFVLSMTRSMGLAATLLGGVLSDRMPTKTLVILSFLLSALGMIGLAVSHPIWLILMCAMTAQLGTSLFQSPARLMLVELTPGKRLQEGLAWLRTANNLGQVFSYGIGAAFSSFGIPGLMIYDAVASLFAAGIGARFIPRTHPAARAKPKTGEAEIRVEPVTRPPLAFWVTAAMLFGSSMIYELYTSGGAGLYRTLYGEEGLRVFSLGMVINTVLCSLFAVWAARHFERPSRMLPIGIALQAVGGAIATIPDVHARTEIYLGMFLLTAGEILFASVSQATLMRLLPSGSRTGTFYGLAMTIQITGRILGGALAFPLVARGAHPAWAFLGLALPFAITGVLVGRMLDAPEEAGILP